MYKETVVMTEMTKLATLLAKADIPFELVAWVCNDEPTIQICSPSRVDCLVDAVCHHFSYGGQYGYLEVMGSVNPQQPNDDVVGWLTANEAFMYFDSRPIE